MEEQTPDTAPQVILTEDTPPPKPPGFWKRQYAAKVTVPQRIFDVLFGAVVPIGLLIADPIMFRGGNCLGLNAGFAAFVYFAVGLGIIALSIWLVAGSRLGRWAALLSGSLLTGGLFAVSVGVVMAPFSLLGLLACIGVLGFIPFITAIVYHRNGLRAFRQVRLLQLHRGEVAGLMLAGVLVAVGVPAAIQMRVSYVVHNAADVIAANRSQGEVDAATQDLRVLANLCLGLCTPNINEALLHAQTSSGEARQRLNSINRQITGTIDDTSCGSILTLLAPRSSSE